MSRLFVGLTVELVPWAESDLSGEVGRTDHWRILGRKLHYFPTRYWSTKDDFLVKQMGWVEYGMGMLVEGRQEHGIVCACWA